MERNSVSEVRSAFDKHDVLLALLLGALSSFKRFEDAVSRPDPEGNSSMDYGHPLVVAALGAISFGRTLERWLEEATEPAGRSEPIPASTQPRLRDFLR